RVSKDGGGLMRPDRVLKVSARPRPSRRSPGSRFAQPVSLLRTRASNHAPQARRVGNGGFAVATRRNGRLAPKTKTDKLIPPYRPFLLRNTSTIRAGKRHSA